MGLPVFNGERFLDSALESLLSQTYRDFELVISDNASTDSTPQILKRWAGNDSRIRLHRNVENLGAAANFNKVLELANGEYFRWAGHDDLIDKYMLSKCVAALETNPDCVLVHPKTSIIDVAGNELGLSSDELDIHEDQPIERLRHFIRNARFANPIFGLMRTKTLRDVGGLPAYNSGDLVMLAGLALRGRFLKLQEPLFYRRVHDDMSWKGMRTPENFAKWFDPGNSHLVVFPMWRLWREFLGEVSRAPLSTAQKRDGYRVVVTEWPRRHHRRLRKEIVRVPRVLARRALKAS